MPVAPLSEYELEKESKREDSERRWYANENRLIRESTLELAKINARTEKEKIKDRKRYIHAITLLKLFNRKVPKIFYKHLS
jgi:hypothetical protein